VKRKLIANSGKDDILNLRLVYYLFELVGKEVEFDQNGSPAV